MGVVRGVLLDESVLLDEDENQNTFFQSGAETLLRRLQYSKLRVGFSYGVGVSAQKVVFLKRMAITYSSGCFFLGSSSINVLNEFMRAWGDNGGDNGESFFFVTSRTDDDLFHKFNNHRWLTVVKRFEGSVATDNPKKLSISKLEELPFIICHFNKKGTGDGVVAVGYVMKPSREEDFAKRGALPMNPSQNGLMFVPITFELPLASQVQEIDVILHKATDEIVTIQLSGSSEFSQGVCFSKGMQELQRYIQHHPDCFIIDPLKNIYSILDRLSIQEILLGLEILNTEGRCRIRAPRFLKVDNFNEPSFAERLQQASLSLPSIVKPQIACGVADAHNMAIVFRNEDFEDLSVPLPAVVQEYVDHSSLLFKFYVLGEKVFHAVKKSMPNAAVLLSLSEENGHKPIAFDSLKSLPTVEEQHTGDGIHSKVSKHPLDLGLVTGAAKWLRRTFDLTIFGFDVVIQEGTGDHVIVDVNYLPSFKEVPNEVAVPAFWDAILNSYKLRKVKAATASIP